MRILSVVTLVSPLGEYGGPVRVAVNQARALQELGHSVTLAAAARGFTGALPTTVEGVPAQLHPAVTLLPRMGFAGLGSPPLWRWMRRHVSDYDVVHVHAGRDLVTLPAARIAGRRGVPYVLQTHGMITPSRRLLAAPLDAALTRPVLRGAQRVLHLTPLERLALLAVAGDDLEVVDLPNGVPHQAQPAVPARQTVLYLARLASRKRPGLFVEAARAVGRSRPDVSFVLVGPDEGEGANVRAGIEQAGREGVDVRWDGALEPERTLEAMSQATIYVLPSIDEPYPMAVLEAMSIGLPVVITDTCGLADTVRDAGAGAVVDATLTALVDAVSALLDDPHAAREQGARGQRYVRDHLDMGSVARRLVSLYGP